MTVRRLFIVLFTLLLFYKPVRPTLDPDMGWHLRTGAYILEHGLPRYDVFSYTVRDHRWVTHEWLVQVGMALLHRLGGEGVLMLAFAGVIGLAFVLVYKRCVGRPYLAAMTVLLGFLASAPTWGVRPQMFNMLMLAIMVYIVEGVRDGASQRWFWALPLLTAVWANLHSGYLLGVVVLGVYVVGGAMQLRWGPPGDRALSRAAVRRLALVTLLCFGASALNPNGVQMWTYPFETLTSRAMQRLIQEWFPPDLHQPIYWPFGLMLAVGTLGLVLSPRRPEWMDLMLFLGMGGAGLLSARHIPLFAVATAPIVARHTLPLFARTRLYPLLTGEQPPPQPSRVVVAAHWLILGALVLAAGLDVRRTVQRNDAAMATTYPVAAVDWIEAQGWQGKRMFNNYNWGGYLVWRGLPVFIDGRADVYGDAFLFLYQDTVFIRPNWRETLDTYGVDYVLISPGSPLSTLLTESAEWGEVYRDDVAQIFARTQD